MKDRSCFVIFVFVLLLVTAAVGQNPNYNNGPIWRVIYVHINPGQGDAFWKDVHDNLKPERGWARGSVAKTESTTGRSGSCRWG